MTLGGSPDPPRFVFGEVTVTGRVLGIDYGRARVGLAVSDPMGITAHPLEVVPGRDREAAFRRIVKVIEEQSVTRVVVGLPLRMDGSEGESVAEVRKFVETLRERITQPIEMWDERLSTAQAERAMLSADMSRAKRKQRRDKVAAQIFLQSWLDAHRD